MLLDVPKSGTAHDVHVPSNPKRDRRRGTASATPLEVSPAWAKVAQWYSRSTCDHRSRRLTPVGMQSRSATPCPMPALEETARHDKSFALQLVRWVGEWGADKPIKRGHHCTPARPEIESRSSSAAKVCTNVCEKKRLFEGTGGG